MVRKVISVWHLLMQMVCLHRKSFFILSAHGVLRSTNSQGYLHMESKVAEKCSIIQKWQESFIRLRHESSNDVWSVSRIRGTVFRQHSRNSYADTNCSTLPHTATHCNKMQHTATHCNIVQHTATHCNTLQQTYHASTRDSILNHFRNKRVQVQFLRYFSESDHKNNDHHQLNHLPIRSREFMHIDV